MTEIFKTPLFFTTLTLFLFYLFTLLYKKYTYFFFNPLITTISFIIIFLKLTGVDYNTYNEGGKVLSFFLGPSVVALGIPLYTQFNEIKKRGKALLITIISGSTVGIISAAVSVRLMGASDILTATMAPKSVTTPIAMSISENIGGIPSLTAAMVVFTGITGAVAGPAFLKLIGIKSKTAFGLAMGSASHGIGTARAAEEGELEGAISGLAICLNGIATAIITPFLIKLILKFL
jgi:predicted murein hydrolase (TIGR00659 family)